jgi:hypothetical protein
MTPMTTTDLLEIAAKAAQLGPFLFAVLFNLVITLVAYRFYNEASKRNAPDIELKTYRSYFRVVTTFGILLVIISIGWWFRQQPAVHYFGGVIQDLKPYEKIASENLYFKIVPKPAPFDDDLRETNVHFLAIQDKPFTENDHFEISYGKRADVSTRESNKFTVKFAPGPEPKYKIVFDKTTSNSKLIQINPSSKETQSRSFITLSSAFAFPLDNFAADQRNGILVAARQDDQTIETVFEVLRQEKIEIASKIAAIDQLVAGDSAKEFLLQSPDDILVLLDLTRHSDRELAYKAKRIAEGLDVDTLLGTALISPDKQKRDTAENILFRIERGRAEKILRGVLARKGGDSTKLSRVLEEVKTGKKERLLIPTGSPQGDRYYVKAEWASDNQEVVACLTKLFKRTLISSRTLEQEEQYMSGRSMRYVYWYAKDWALTMFNSIQECGGKATFVGIDSSR